MPVFFDDSLPSLADTVVAEVGERVLSAGVVLRDASGRLSFFSGSQLGAADVERVNARLREVLGPYADPDQAFVPADAFGAEAIRGDVTARAMRVRTHTVKVVDRRLSGADWLRAPAAQATPPARFVFASVKGGVGRSTAICVAAAHLAAGGLRVLAVDLDLEAPGLGALLLTEGTLPEFGVMDALVEDGLGGLSDPFLRDLIGPSSLAAQGGRIDVMPALGRRSMRNPADVLSKLARAYAEDISADGTVSTVLDQVRKLIARVANGYDVVLVDARAGLHETSASAIIGLGAEVFLFGRDEEQTFQGYSLLLAHLARFVNTAEPTPEWVERLTPVQALAPVDAAAREAFAQRWETVVRGSGLLPEPAPPVEVPPPAEFQDVPWEDDQPDEAVLPEEASLLHPLAILRSADYDGFAPLNRQDLLSRGVYEGVFRHLLTRIDAVSSPNDQERM